MVCGCSDGKLKGRKMWLEKEQQNLDGFINLSGLSLQISAPFFFNRSFSYRFGWGGVGEARWDGCRAATSW